MSRARIERGMMGQVTAIGYRELPDGARVVVPAAQRKERRPDVWRASARLCLADGRLVTVHRFRRTRGAAEAALRAAAQQRLAEQHQRVSAQTSVAELAEQWTEAIADDDRLTTGTRELYCGTARRYLTRDWEFARMAVGDVRAGDVEDFLSAVAAKGGSGSAKAVRSVLMAVFGRAVRYELIERNVIKLAAPVPKHKPKGPERNHTRALTDGEARRLLAFAHAEPLYNENGLDVADLVEIMLLTGVRIGEALAVRWLDVQLGQPPLASVGGTIKRIAGEGLIRQVGTKSDAGMRDVDLSPRAVQVLTGRRPAMHDRLAPVFPSAVGGWRDPSNTNKQIRRLLDDVDLAWVTPHTFRRTFLTRLGDLGVPLRQIADMAGHANPAMTARHYLGRQGARRELQAALTSFDYG